MGLGAIVSVLGITLIVLGFMATRQISRQSAEEQGLDEISREPVICFAFIEKDL